MKSASTIGSGAKWIPNLVHVQGLMYACELSTKLNRHNTGLNSGSSS